MMSDPDPLPEAEQPHLVLLLGAGGMSATYVLAEAATVTPRVSVVWFGSATAASNAPLREQWRTQFSGDWLATSDVARIADLVELIHRRRPVDGVATFGEPLIEVQAQAQQRLGLPGNDPAVVRAVQSKVAQRRRLRATGVEKIRFSEIRTAADLPAAISEVGFPAVLKPAWGSGSFLVSMVRDEQELATRFAQALAAQGQAPVSMPESLFLLEEYLEGENWHLDERFGDYCSVESLIEDGVITHVAVTDKLPLHPGFVEAGDLVPSSLPDARVAQIQAHASRVIEALGLRWGATHTELKLTATGPACIELNARLGGGSGHFVRASTGADLAADVIRLALGRSPVGDYRPDRYALFGSVPPPGQPSRLEHQTTTKQLLAAFPALGFCKTRYQVGALLHPVRPENLLTYLVTGPDVDSCRSASADVEDSYHADFSTPIAAS